MTCNIEHLPADMIGEIASWLDPDSFNAFRCSCKRINSAILRCTGMLHRRKIQFTVFVKRSQRNTTITIWYQYEHNTVRSTGHGFDFIVEQNWFYCNRRHRECDLPAIDNIDGSQSWYRYGLLDRSDGPAEVYRHVSRGTNRGVLARWYTRGTFVKEARIKK